LQVVIFSAAEEYSFLFLAIFGNILGIIGELKKKLPERIIGKLKGIMYSSLKIMPCMWSGVYHNITLACG